MNIRNIAFLFVALLFCTATYAQSTDGGSTVNSTSNSQVSSSSGSTSNNAGNAQQAQQAITFNSPQQPTRTTQRVETAPSMGMGSFGTSFSSDNCSNTLAGQVSVVGFGASAGKAVIEKNCAHLRRGYAFGQAAAFARSSGQNEMADKQEAMVNYEFCTADGADSETAKACESLGLIQNGKPAIRAAMAEQQREQAPAHPQLDPRAQASLDQHLMSNQRWYQNAQQGR